MLSKFTLGFVFLFNLKFICGILTNRTDDFVDLWLTQPSSNDEHFRDSNKCAVQLHTSLEKLRRRQPHLKSAAFIDLSGYALHQTLRHLPLDMYVTGIRVKTPGVGDWVRIQKCQFSNRNNRMTAQILFNDLIVSGTIQLLDDNEILKNSFQPNTREFCKMSLRLQRAGLGINAFPTRGKSRGIDVRTEARFMDPKFLSVHAYGCKLNDIFRSFENHDSETREEYPEGELKQIGVNDKYGELQMQDRLLHSTNYSKSNYSTRAFRYADLSPRQITRRLDIVENKEENPEVRIITLNPDIRSGEDSSKWLNLHNEQDNNLNDFHRHRVLNTRFHTPTERDKLKAVLYIQNLIAQHANHVFQTQGPFSQMQKPLFKPFRHSFSQPPKGQIVSSITELDENLKPIRPISQRPFEALFSQSDQIVNSPNHPGFHNYFDEVSKEMEDIFLRGIKTLLTRYVEKQLEIPLKEALMTNIGYTISYG